MTSSVLVLQRLALKSGLLLAPLVLLLSCASSRPTAASETTVYIVRHAEKETTPGLADPPLMPEGQQRAVALREQLGKRPIAAIFTTNTLRTRTTASPLAESLKLAPQVYDARQLGALAQRIKSAYAGKTVVVIGHSNTILETAEALGATRPVATVSDAEYDYLFEVKLPATGAATVTAQRYGASSTMPAAK